jgi:hypothetical protein
MSDSQMKNKKMVAHISAAIQDLLYFWKRILVH